jgi:cytoplasmic iron level regulating protein YaaA (DUF328/UPF0246 family)
MKLSFLHVPFCPGLYGVCRPYDDVKPVRDIPMNAKIKTKKGARHFTFGYAENRVTKEM